MTQTTTATPARWCGYDSALPLVEPEDCGEQAGATIRFWARSPDRVDDVGWEKGYVAHLVEACGGGRRVGYLRIVYATAEQSYEVAPTGLHFLASNRGWCLQFDDQRELWLRAHLYARQTPRSFRGLAHPPAPWHLSKKDVPDSETVAADLAVIAAYGETERRRWLRWATIPTIAYSRVDDGEQSGTSWQRRGVAQAMYIAGARRLGARGMVLAAAVCQSPSAQALWAHFEAAPDVKTRRLRLPAGRGRQRLGLVLDYRGRC